MPTIKRFEDLECWKEARRFVNLIYSLTGGKSFSKDAELVERITGSAVSSMGNIAEGFYRNSNEDFLKALNRARAFVAETMSHAYVAVDQGYITPEELLQVQEGADLVWKKLNGLIRYLNKKSRAPKEIGPKLPNEMH